MSIIAFYCRVFTEYNFAQCVEKFTIQSFIYNFSSAYAPPPPPLPFFFGGGKRKGQTFVTDGQLDRMKTTCLPQKRGCVSKSSNTVVVTYQTHFDV